MKRARISAISVLVLAMLWIGSGYLRPSTVAEPLPRLKTAQKAPFKVVVMDAKIEPHTRKLELTGRTQSDQRIIVSARTSGIVSRLPVRRGSVVAEGDVIAELSDEAREAKVMQARARLSQRAAELEAREDLAKRGNFPVLSLEQLRAEKRAAEAELATAEAELLRTSITAPVAGMVNDLSVEIGQGLLPGGAIAELIKPDPMLMVVEVPERRLNGLTLGEKAQVRLVTGEMREGVVRFIARRPAGQTRTYRVDIAFANPDGQIPDGIAAEVSLNLAAVNATRVPRSALTFSAEGQLGLRVVDAQSIVRFVPVSIVDDEAETLWVSGLSPGLAIITRGQDFIREGETVEAVREAAP